MSDQNFRHSNGRFAKGHPGGPGRLRNPVSATAIELGPPSGDGPRNLLGEHATLAQAMMNGDITPWDAQAAVRVFKALQAQMRRAAYQAETVRPPKTEKTA